ncbi:flagellar assembly protein FliW [Candidatus Latescibacterota bacterium]
MTDHKKGNTVEIKTSRGTMYVSRKDVIHFPEGLFGFEEYKDYAVFDIKDCKPFKSMLSIQEGGPDFVVVDPFLIVKDYNPLELYTSPEELPFGSQVELTVLSIVTLAEDPKDITANFRGPLFLNISTGIAKQVILPDDQYSTHELLQITENIHETVFSCI